MGRFADGADVSARFEGTIPSNRAGWVTTRISDVEAVLLGLVPSLEQPDSVIGAGRLARVKALVCDKVLDLYRNPERTTQRTSTSGPYSDSASFSRDIKAGIWFSEDELAQVRPPSSRSRVRSIPVSPWRVGW